MLLNSLKLCRGNLRGTVRMPKERGMIYCCFSKFIRVKISWSQHIWWQALLSKGVHRLLRQHLVLSSSLVQPLHRTGSLLACIYVCMYACINQSLYLPVFCWLKPTMAIQKPLLPPLLLLLLFHGYTVHFEGSVDIPKGWWVLRGFCYKIDSRSPISNWSLRNASCKNDTRDPFTFDYPNPHGRS